MNKFPESEANQVFVFRVSSVETVEEIVRVMQENRNNFGVSFIVPVVKGPSEFLVVFQKAPFIRTYDIYGDMDLKVKAVNKTIDLKVKPITNYHLNYFVSTIHCYLPNHQLLLDKIEYFYQIPLPFIPSFLLEFLTMKMR